MGHKRTIRPNAKKLSSLFQAREHMDWKTFARKVKLNQRGFMGEADEMRPVGVNFMNFHFHVYARSQQNQQECLLENAMKGIMDHPD